MHPKLLLDAEVLCMHDSSVAKMCVQQVETMGLHACRGLVIVALMSKLRSNL